MADYDNFSRKGYVLNLSRFNVGAELEALKMILTPQFSKKSMTIDLEQLPDVVVMSDRYKFRQIMYNLLSNAFKFSDEETEVLVRMTTEDNRIRIEVINKGLLIDQDDSDRIFDARYRAENANDKDPHGKGLGLSISTSLASFMEGKLYLKDNSKGTTVFCLELPKMIGAEPKKSV